MTAYHMRVYKKLADIGFYATTHFIDRIAQRNIDIKAIKYALSRGKCVHYFDIGRDTFNTYHIFNGVLLCRRDNVLITAYKIHKNTEAVKYILNRNKLKNINEFIFEF